MGRSAGRARWWTGLLPVLVLAMVASSCSSGGNDPSTATLPDASTIPEASTLLRVASEAWPDCLNPLTCDDEEARTLVLQHVLPKLMELDESGGYVPGPVLAGAPEVRVDDETGEQTVIFEIAPEARWHDGRPITSSDVTGTWLAHLNTPGADTRGHELITAIDDSDPMIARVTLSQPWADWPELFGGHEGWLLQADAFGGDTDLSGRFTESLPFGAGPYELVSFEDRALVLVARDDHWDTDRRALIDQVRIEHYPGLSQADEAEGPEGLVRPGVDAVLPARPVGEVPERMDVRQALTPEVVGLVLDRRTPPIGSQAVRLAIDAAVDREALLELVAEEPPALVTCLGGLPQGPACDESDLPEDGPAPQEAEFLLELDGWPRDPSGPRGRPGMPLATPITFDPALPGAEAMAESVAETLAAVGFTTDVQPLDADTWAQPDRVDGTGVGIFAVPLGTADRLAGLYRCESGMFNPLAWCEAANQQLAAQLVVAPDLERRFEIQTELGDLAAEATAWLPLHQRVRPWLVDPERVIPPESVPLGSGPLGSLHAFQRAD